jgi:hypothetical protein
MPQGQQLGVRGARHAGACPPSVPRLQLLARHLAMVSVAPSLLGPVPLGVLSVPRTGLKGSMVHFWEEGSSLRRASTAGQPWAAPGR